MRAFWKCFWKSSNSRLTNAKLYNTKLFSETSVHSSIIYTWEICLERFSKLYVIIVLIMRFFIHVHNVCKSYSPRYLSCPPPTNSLSPIITPAFMCLCVMRVRLRAHVWPSLIEVTDRRFLNRYWILPSILTFAKPNVWKILLHCSLNFAFAVSSEDTYIHTFAAFIYLLRKSFTCLLSTPILFQF